MKKPLRTFLLVRAVLDDNEVPYLVAHPGMPSRKVGIRRVANPPEKPDHYAEHFEPCAHVVDAGDALHLAHYRREAKAGTLQILGECSKQSLHDAELHFAAAATAASKLATPAPSPTAAPAATPTPDAAPTPATAPTAARAE
jgi:hypothetical protein